MNIVNQENYFSSKSNALGLNEVKKEIFIGEDKLTLSTGFYAHRADGAVMVSIGGTCVLCTVVASKEDKPDPGFLPLTVNYREMYYGAGKIPGGFFKREGKALERETLISRVIDRSIRPVFHKHFRKEVQIICTVLSYDMNHNPDIMALIGSSAALAVSGIPLDINIGSIRVGKIGDEYIINPNISLLKKSEINLVMTASKESILMVEADAKNLDDEIITDVLEIAQKNITPIINLIEDLKKEVNKKEFDIKLYDHSSLKKEIEINFKSLIEEIIKIQNKQERQDRFNNLLKVAIDQNKDNQSSLVSSIFSDIRSKIQRDQIIKESKRIDNRKLDEVRAILCKTRILPRTHGSSLFIRGDTQALVTTTLGTSGDEQIVNDITQDEKNRFLLHYNFLPYSVGEVGALRGPTRREIGHGNLGYKSIMNLLPEYNKFPYVVRIVSEIISCDGSSSMASVCGASLSLMDAGVPITEHVAGIAMGLVLDNNNRYKILTDIISDEDMIGDMDLKVAGTKNGITAIQMDIKSTSITLDIIKESISKARIAINGILDDMNFIIPFPNKDQKNYSIKIKNITINSNKIKDLIGPGGKVIQNICAVTTSKIDIDKTGNVTISSEDEKGLSKAIDMINDVIQDPEIGMIYNGKVIKKVQSGFFIRYFRYKEGFLHLNDTNKDIEIKEGMDIQVKLLSIENNRSKLTVLF